MEKSKTVTINPRKRRLTIFLRFMDWIGSARLQNQKINDEVATLKFQVDILRLANRQLRAELKDMLPLVDYAKRRKASLAAYKRRAAK